MTATANKQTEMTTMTMNTKTMNTKTNEGGLTRFTEEEYDATFASSGSTPRPTMNAADMTERQHAAAVAILSFSQVAKYAAAASKRRRSPKSRTDYWMMNKHVVQAFNELEEQIKQNPAIMTQSDFNLLKQAISNFRVKLIVHDSISFDELNALQTKTKQDIDEAEAATHAAFIDNTSPDSEQKYLDAKDRLHDLKAWSADLAKEIHRIEPKVKYSSMGGGLFRHDFNKPTDPPGVPSQHAHIAHATGILLRNILSPATIHRTFISLQALTQKIRDELVMFLNDSNRHKDRHEVIKQIKDACVRTATAKNTKLQKQNN